ncbi:MAG: ribose-5-phosphate isomerase RpiA [Trueperaceae bacterium]
MHDPERWKREAALSALALVENDMLLGLGTGSTAKHFVEELGARLQDGRLRGIRGVPTSRRTEEQATRLGIPLVDLPASGVDLAVDGMDEVTDDLDAIKGLGGALTREKIVAASARRFVLIGDDRKRVMRLGEKSPVPVEIVPFGQQRTLERLRELGADPRPRVAQGGAFTSDNGNLVVDCHFAAAFDAGALARALDALPGVIEHGLFLGMVERAFVAGDDGVITLTAAPRAVAGAAP